MSEEEIKRQKRKVALTHLAKGQVSKAVSWLTSHGVADTRNPTVMAELKSKYVRRSRELPVSVTMGQPVDNVSGLKIEGGTVKSWNRLLTRDRGNERRVSHYTGRGYAGGGDDQAGRLLHAVPDWVFACLVLWGVGQCDNGASAQNKGETHTSSGGRHDPPDPHPPQYDHQGEPSSAYLLLGAPPALPVSFRRA